jgi:hypothetical protein
MRGAYDHDASFGLHLEGGARLSESYHGKRGDQEGLVASAGPCVTCVVVKSSRSKKNTCHRPARFDWNAMWRPSGAQAAP